MFARNLSMHLKADGVSHFKQKLETEIIPLLHKQKGFLDEITFLYLNGREVQAFSVAGLSWAADERRWTRIFGWPRQSDQINCRQTPA